MTEPAIRTDDGADDGVVCPSSPRPDVRVTFPDARIFKAPLGTSLQHLISVAYARSRVPIVAALQNARLRELSTTLSGDAEIVPISIQQDDGARIFRRSLIFLMVTASAEEFPDAHLVVQHSVPGFGGYYCEMGGRGPFSDDEIVRIERRMREIADSDAPISKLRVEASDAVVMFADRGEHDKALLFSHAASDTVPLYELRGRRDYFHGYMVPSAGCLRPSRFAIIRRVSSCSSLTRPIRPASMRPSPIRSCSAFSSARLGSATSAR